MEADWPTPSARVQELIRMAAERLLDPTADWLEEVHSAILSGERMRSVAEDPVIAHQVRRGTTANLTRWASFNVRYPGARVPPEPVRESLSMTRDLVRRGLDERALDTFRTGQSAIWQQWMRICFELTSDSQELREILDISSKSMNTFANETVDLVVKAFTSERHLITQSNHTERLVTVMLILDDAPVPRARAEAQLGYELTGTHTAAILWGGAETAAEQLESAAEELAKVGRFPRHLTVVASAAALWLWLPGELVASTARLENLLGEHPDLRVTIGRPGRDLDGFRRSHLDAATAQRILARIDSPRRLAHYSDVALVALMTTEPAKADQFVMDTLGDLVNAEPESCEILATYIREQFNASSASERLYVHRNTFIRRLRRAESLLPRPLANNVTNVAVALEVLHWRGERTAW